MSYNLNRSISYRVGSSDRKEKEEEFSFLLELALFVVLEYYMHKVFSKHLFQMVMGCILVSIQNEDISASRFDRILSEISNTSRPNH